MECRRTFTCTAPHSHISCFWVEENYESLPANSAHRGCRFKALCLKLCRYCVCCTSHPSRKEIFKIFKEMMGVKVLITVSDDLILTDMNSERGVAAQWLAQLKQLCSKDIYTFLWGVCMFSPSLCGFSLNTSFLPQLDWVRLIGNWIARLPWNGQAT